MAKSTLPPHVTNTELIKWHDSGEYLQIDRHRIFCHASANKSKPALLMIHGFPSSSFDWRAQFHALGTSHFVICADMLGFGFSDKPSDIPYTVALQATIIEKILQHYQVNKYDILAHDFGDTVAQELIARDQLRPTETRHTYKLCMLNGGFLPEAVHHLLMQKLLASNIGPGIIRFMNWPMFHRNISKICSSHLPRHEIEAMWQLLKLRNGYRLMPAIMQYMHEREVHRERWIGSLNSDSLEQQLIIGLRDPISGEDTLNRFRELFPNANSIALPSLGHYPQLEDPERINFLCHNFFVNKV